MGFFNDNGTNGLFTSINDLLMLLCFQIVVEGKILPTLYIFEINGKIMISFVCFTLIP